MSIFSFLFNNLEGTACTFDEQSLQFLLKPKRSDRSARLPEAVLNTLDRLELRLVCIAASRSSRRALSAGGGCRVLVATVTTSVSPSVSVSVIAHSRRVSLKAWVAGSLAIALYEAIFGLQLGSRGCNEFES